MPNQKRNKECWTVLSQNLTELAQQTELQLAVFLTLRELTKTLRSFVAQQDDRPEAGRILLVIIA